MPVDTASRGRPPIGSGFKVRLFPAQRAALAALAELAGSSASDIIREAIDREITRRRGQRKAEVAP